MDNTPLKLQQTFTLCSYMVHVEGNAAWHRKLATPPETLREQCRQEKSEVMRNQIAEHICKFDKGSIL